MINFKIEEGKVELSAEGGVKLIVLESLVLIQEIKKYIEKEATVKDIELIQRDYLLGMLSIFNGSFEEFIKNTNQEDI
ncbi:hypothetical protein B5E58_10940 [Tyzzerella sp. An114]|uniref:hypothetical protein n=1 Tax=Tyzzerella sp. An114 TaxID=1965545 RepID=UPI000B4411BC|nr:hypothetical protein [Tyzzerella sp. An114]OUQ56356.1 hypothetical protein B5E58_10940 [Tyzzerella sp. An114]HIT73907.1 hypothetical protein [Candidatus Fimicola cottocaccae]